ncbi:hypothetical protein HCH_00136 [Hahella chejuensis KCTC 2396]|uniref:Uncharacterized protein n=1 Tax=Hahella chejuensis (strain KCTC 2396) TaxID=349521 RepID=Q2SQL9_HAHCH|nr:hypothetical protein HCH_00136 [Hahella chejuensis KCTC 2396]
MPKSWLGKQRNFQEGVFVMKMLINIGKSSYHPENCLILS